jgi:hypothetical protein
VQALSGVSTAERNDREAALFGSTTERTEEKALVGSARLA